MVARVAQEWPAAQAAVEPTERRKDRSPALVPSNQVRRRQEKSERAIVRQLKLIHERAIELARSVVTRPNGVPIQVHWHSVDCAPQPRSGQVAVRCIVGPLPRTMA